MPTKVYIAVRGGTIQWVRAEDPITVHIIDYDDLSAGTTIESESDFEQRNAGGKTATEIEASTEAVY